MVLQDILAIEMDETSESEADRPVRPLRGDPSDPDTNFPRTVGTWFGEDDARTLREFDKIGKERYGSEYSRSEKVKEAMAAHVAIERAFDSVGYHFDSRQDRAAFLRQLIYDYARREGDF